MTKTYNEIQGDGGSDILGQVVSQQERLADRMRGIRRVIAVMSGKGGVGKSALTANLAVALANQGWAVGALDADLNSPTLAKMLGARHQQLFFTQDGVEPAIGVVGVKVMSMDLFLETDETPLSWQRLEGLAADSFVWKDTMETTAVREFLADTDWGELDCLLIDLPPGVERFSTISRWIPDLEGLTVTIPSAISQLVIKKSIRAVQETGRNLIGLVENMSGYVCPECGTIGPLYSSSLSGEEVASSLGIPFLGSIPFDTLLAQACDEGIPFILDHPETSAAHALMNVVEGISNFDPSTLTENPSHSEEEK
jgi:ATP-binding protein involved in chromosome partitioning